MEAVPAALKLFYNCFSALGGRHAGGSVSADSAAGEADALINSAVHPVPIGRCNSFLVEGVRAPFWASVS